MKRTFIAVKVAPSAMLTEVMNKLRSELKGEEINWVDPDKLHITLFFLGDTAEDEIVDVKDMLSDISNDFASFTFSLNSLGMFPHRENPRVIWAGVDESDELDWLQGMISDELEYMGFESDNREFRPHLTLGRIKEIQDMEKLEALLDEYQDQEFQKVQVKDLFYYQSVLKPGGPVYQSLRNYKLK